MTRAQLSMEFILLFTLTFIIFLVIVGVAVSGFQDRSQSRSVQEAESLVSSLGLDFQLVDRGPGTVAYALELPRSIENSAYNLTLTETGIIGVSIPAKQVQISRPSVPFTLTPPDLVSIGDNGIVYVEIEIDEPASPCVLTVTRTPAPALEVHVDAC